MNLRHLLLLYFLLDRILRLHQLLQLIQSDRRRHLYPWHQSFPLAPKNLEILVSPWYLSHLLDQKHQLLRLPLLNQSDQWHPQNLWILYFLSDLMHRHRR